MYGKNEYTVEPYAKGSIEKHFAEAIKNLPESVYFEKPKKRWRGEGQDVRARLRAGQLERRRALREGRQALCRGQGSGVEVDQFAKLSPTTSSGSKGYIKLRDALKEAQQDAAPGRGLAEASLEALNKAYTAFTKKHGSCSPSPSTSGPPRTRTAKPRPPFLTSASTSGSACSTSISNPRWSPSSRRSPTTTRSRRARSFRGGRSTSRRARRSNPRRMRWRHAR
jgi:hypothetical protein